MSESRYTFYAPVLRPVLRSRFGEGGSAFVGGGSRLVAPERGGGGSTRHVLARENEVAAGSRFTFYVLRFTRHDCFNYQLSTINHQLQ